MGPEGNSLRKGRLNDLGMVAHCILGSDWHECGLFHKDGEEGMKRGENCGECIFWFDRHLVDSKKHKPGSGGWCRVNPPEVSLFDCKGIWPVTKWSDWCGKFVRDNTP